LQLIVATANLKRRGHYGKEEKSKKEKESRQEEKKMLPLSE